MSLRMVASVQRDTVELYYDGEQLVHAGMLCRVPRFYGRIVSADFSERRMTFGRVSAWTYWRSRLLARLLGRPV